MNANLINLIMPNTQVCAGIVLFTSAALIGIRWINIINLMPKLWKSNWGCKINCHFYSCNWNFGCLREVNTQLTLQILLDFSAASASLSLFLISKLAY